MEGVANLFDVAMVFALGLMVALISAYSLMDLFNPSVETTILKKKASGEMEIVSKKGKEIKVRKVTGKQLQGEGIRLGVAYQLKDGKVVYVPENPGAEKERTP
jgi:hypothetical protein